MLTFIPPQLWPVLIFAASVVIVLFIVLVLARITQPMGDFSTPIALPLSPEPFGIDFDNVFNIQKPAIDTEELFAPSTGNTYERHGASVACYQDNGKRRMWEMTFLSESFAIMLMRDLRGE